MIRKSGGIFYMLSLMSILPYSDVLTAGFLKYVPYLSPKLQILLKYFNVFRLSIRFELRPTSEFLKLYQPILKFWLIL